jgi:methylglutamate dehydrogenase subunit D
MADATPLAARSAFDGLLDPVGPPEAAGVVASERRDLQIATVIGRRGAHALSARVKAAYGIDLSPGPRHVGSGRMAFVGTGPRTWLAICEGGDPLPDELRRDLGDVAAVSDQSDGYGVLRLSGPKVRAMFEKGLGVDLHPRVFHAGDAAVTACAHIGLILWQLDEAPTYEVAVFRSLASGFRHWLYESAAEYGLRVGATGRG